MKDVEREFGNDDDAMVEAQSPVGDPDDEPHEPTEQECVDEAIWQSFPASDPPSWTLGVRRADRKPHGREQS